MRRLWGAHQSWFRQIFCKHDYEHLWGGYDSGARYWEARFCGKCGKSELRLLMTPHHPNCRCVMVPIEYDPAADDERAARADAATGIATTFGSEPEEELRAHCEGDADQEGDDDEAWRGDDA